MRWRWWRLGQSQTTLYYAGAPDMKTQGIYGSIAAASTASSSTPAAPPASTGSPTTPIGY